MSRNGGATGEKEKRPKQRLPGSALECRAAGGLQLFAGQGGTCSEQYRGRRLGHRFKACCEGGDGGAGFEGRRRSRRNG
ncbi:hypothetical protein [Paenibacillus mucilaginosus]|uniref:hypothetical protein n=1 Tax=Paenibacillus mucilaginosus TaxID=61624 RepID=UPI001EE670E4|nr:hypothetical protein [Paenibacillus mucilaginosus]